MNPDSALDVGCPWTVDYVLAAVDKRDPEDLGYSKRHIVSLKFSFFFED